MKHKMSDIKRDFPWTVVKFDNPPVEPWLAEGEGWFDDLPAGWADVIYDYMIKLDRVLKHYKLEEFLYIIQTKEKFGGLRYYYEFVLPWDREKRNYAKTLTSEQQKGIKIYDQLVWDMEAATETVCIDCGSTENVQCYGGWIHFACEDCESKRIAKWGEARREWYRVKNG